MLNNRAMIIEEARYPFFLRSYFKEGCEAVLGLPLAITEVKAEIKSAVTSCAKSIAVSDKSSYLLIVKCDDDLVDIAMDQASDRFCNNEKMKNTLKLMRDLSNALSEKIISMYRDQPALDYLKSSIGFQEDMVFEEILEHPCGGIHITMTKLDLS